MSQKDKRRDALLRFIRRRSGRRFTVAVIAREFGVNERTIQGRPLCFGSIRTNQANAELQFAASAKRKYHRLYGQPQAAISQIERRIEKTDDALLEGWSQRERKRPVLLNRIRAETHFAV